MHRAFVVQLKNDNLRGEALRGRAEHLRSGQVVHFEGIGQLLEFFFRSLESEEAEESSLSGQNETDTGAT